MLSTVAPTEIESSGGDDHSVTVSSARRPRPQRSILRPALLVVGLALMMGGILTARGWGPFAAETAPVSVSAATPVSPDIEAAYGIRITGVDITAAGGMIQLRYQVLDADKAGALHGGEVTTAIVGPDGHVYADPALQGHSHVGTTGAAGATDTLLLANAQAGVHPGDRVAVRIGDLELRGVPVR